MLHLYNIYWSRLIELLINFNTPPFSLLGWGGFQAGPWGDPHPVWFEGVQQPREGRIFIFIYYFIWFIFPFFFSFSFWFLVIVCNPSPPALSSFYESILFFLLSLALCLAARWVLFGGWLHSRSARLSTVRGFMFWVLVGKSVVYPFCPLWKGCMMVYCDCSVC